MPRLKNTDVMARSGGSAYNPGGHRGRSGDNGAGNHRYDPQHKALLEEIDAEIKLRKQQEAAETRRVVRHGKDRAKIIQRLASQKVSAPGRNLRRLTQEDMGEPLALRCSHGHDFHLIPSQITASRARTLCPTCARKSHGTPRADARLKYYMRLDEQGMDVVRFTNTTERALIEDRETGEQFEVMPTNAESWKRTRDDGLIRFVADDDDHVFVFRGRQPEVNHPFIAHLLDNYPIEETGLVRGNPLLGVAGMRTVIQQFLDEGDKVVNISLNPTWEDGGTYTWGEIPLSAALAKYMKSTKETWQ